MPQIDNLNTEIINRLRTYNLSDKVDQELERDIMELIILNKSDIKIKSINNLSLVRNTNYYPDIIENNPESYSCVPPQHIKEFQRANLPNHSMFYGILKKDDEDTFIEQSAASFEACGLIRSNESFTTNKSIIYHSTWKINIELKVISLTDYQTNPFMNFIISQFQRRVTNDNEYKICAYFTKCILEYFNDIDGVIYKSVQAKNHNRCCVSIKPESVSKLSMQKLQKYRVEKCPGNYEYKLIDNLFYCEAIGFLRKKTNP